MIYLFTQASCIIHYTNHYFYDNGIIYHSYSMLSDTQTSTVHVIGQYVNNNVHIDYTSHVSMIKNFDIPDTQCTVKGTRKIHSKVLSRLIADRIEQLIFEKL